MERLKRALLIEQETELDRYRALMGDKPMHERIAAGVTVYPVQFLETRFNHFEQLQLSFSINPDHSLQAFSSGGKVQLFSSNHSEFVEGIVDQTDDDGLLVKFNEDAPPDWIKDGKLGLNALPDTRTTEIQLKTIDAIIAGEIPIATLFYNQPAKLTYGIETVNFDGFNPSQNHAINAALSANPFQIIHGPPGTGKTQTLVKIITERASNGKRVLVCAPTNAAVDHITKQLARQNVAVLRLGNSLKIDAELTPLTLRGKLLESGLEEITKRLKKEAAVIRKKAFRYVRNFDKAAYQERKELRKELNTIRKDIRRIESDLTRACLDKAKVITGTFIGLQDKRLNPIDFDLVAVDEAGQALEPAIWAVAKMAPQLVLAGDPFQLPPTLFSNEAVKLGLATSLIEKGIDLGIPTTLLDVQYRMNDKIMQFSNHYFYDGKLMSAGHVKELHIIGEEFEPIEFIDTAGCSYEEEKDEFGGIANQQEAELIAKRIDQLPKSELKISVLSPYRRQVNTLKNIFATSPVSCQTVDSFQGQEEEVIVVSLVRSNESGAIGFLTDYRRMNVALTRAKKKLIVVGDSATIGNDLFYSAFLDYAEKNGSYRTAWEFLD